MMGSGRVVRIPFPPRKAGLKDRASGRVRWSRLRGTAFRLRGSRTRTSDMRGRIRDEARIYRSPWRWLFVSVAWLAMVAGALLVPYDRFSVYHFGLGVLLLTSFVAAFFSWPRARTIASALLLVGAAVLAAVAEQPEVAAGVGLPALGLFLLNSFRF